jgi:hypothetical protein
MRAETEQSIRQARDRGYDLECDSVAVRGTAAPLAELRFNLIAGRLPNDEASALRLSFQREMNRLYAAAAEEVEM